MNQHIPQIAERLKHGGYIQVSGVHDEDEALMLARRGVHGVGFPLRLPVNKPDIDESAAARIAAALPAGVVPVCVTYLNKAAEIHDLCRSLGMSIAQLHGDIDPVELMRLRDMVPRLFIIKSLVVREWSRENEKHDNRRELVHLAQTLEPHVDAFITDTHDPVSKADGATGKTHDWTISSLLTRKTTRPVILAGGLGPHNVTQGVRCVHPDGVDAHTRLEGPDGRKDEELVRRFVSRVRAGYGCCM